MDEKLKYILEGAVRLFKQYGLRSISMDEIARSMGMSKKTLYQYIDNKDELVAKALDYVIEKNAFCVLENASGLNAIDTLLEISRLVRAEAVEVNPIVIFDLQKYYPSIYENVLNKKRTNIYLDILKNYEQGIKEGIYRSDIDIDIVAKLYIKRLMDIADPEFIKAPVGKVFHVMYDSHIRSIVNEKGLTYYEEKVLPLVQKMQ